MDESGNGFPHAEPQLLRRAPLFKRAPSAPT